MLLKKSAVKGLCVAILSLASSIAFADTALFNSPGTYGTDPVTGEVNSYTGVDYITGLQADAHATQWANGLYTVYSNPTEHLKVANINDPALPGGVTFTLPGHTFDLTSLRVAGRYISPGIARIKLNYTILAYYPGNSVPVAVPFTLSSLASPILKTFSVADTNRLKGLEKAVIQYGPTVGSTFFIETNFVPH